MIRNLWNRLFKSDKCKCVNHSVLSKEDVNLIWLEFPLNTASSNINNALKQFLSLFKEKYPDYKVIVLVKYVH